MLKFVVRMRGGEIETEIEVEGEVKVEIEKLRLKES